MATIRERPFFTKIYDNPSEFAPSTDSVYIHARSVEVRSTHIDSWPSRGDVALVPITEGDDSSMSYPAPDGVRREVLLRSERQAKQLWAEYATGEVYLDITGLSHHVWAPLLRSALETRRRVNIVYVEPMEYTFSATPTEGAIFDLSERIAGITPIPGFASLAPIDEDRTCFIPLLGFEGPRLAYILEQVQPPREKIIPVIGVPGFRPEYPFHAYQGNRLPLLESQAWRNIRFATANDPFSLFYALEDIESLNPFDILQIAPIGTKPHALGAVLFYLSRPSKVELVYDHPIRKLGRTTGASRLLVYDVGSLGISNR